MWKSRGALVGYCFAAASALLVSDIALAQLPQIPIAQKLKLPPDTAPQSGDMFPEEEVNFGLPVATDGQTAIVSVGRGRAAYAYVRKPNGTWVYQDDLPAPGPFERVGPGAAVLGDVALVQGKASSDYVVFVFTRNAGEWTNTQTLPGGYQFGGHNFIALGTDYAAIGVPYVYEGVDVDHSTVEIYDSVGAGTYVHNTTLFPAAPADTSWQMGWETQVSGNTVLSSAPGNGELDVFVRNGGVWSQQATLPFSTSDPLYAFDGNRVVLPLSGQEFVRRNGTWSPAQTIAHPYDPQAQFDNYAAMDGKRLLLADQGGARVFLFERQVGGNYLAVAELAPAPKSCPFVVAYGHQALKLTIKGRTVFRSCATTHSENPDFEGSVLVYDLPPLQGSTDE